MELGEAGDGVWTTILEQLAPWLEGGEALTAPEVAVGVVESKTPASYGKGDKLHFQASIAAEAMESIEEVVQ